MTAISDLSQSLMVYVLVCSFACWCLVHDNANVKPATIREAGTLIASVHAM